MKDAKRRNQQVTLVRDRLYINTELYVVPRIGVIPTDEDYLFSVYIVSLYQCITMVYENKDCGCGGKEVK